MESKLNKKIGLILSLVLALCCISHYTTTLKVYAISNTISNTTDNNTDNSNSSIEPIDGTIEATEPIIIEEVITVEKRIEVEKEVTPFKLKDLGTFKVTAYCPCSKCCGKWAESSKVKITSIGAGAYEGVTIAVDPKLIPYGTKLYSEDFGVRIATDCGGAIKGKRLDLYFSSHEKALQFGVKDVRLYGIVE